jgi:hypothetical protein
LSFIAREQEEPDRERIVVATSTRLSRANIFRFFPLKAKSRLEPRQLRATVKSNSSIISSTCSFTPLSWLSTFSSSSRCAVLSALRPLRTVRVLPPSGGVGVERFRDVARLHFLRSL